MLIDRSQHRRIGAKVQVGAWPGSALRLARLDLAARCFRRAMALAPSLAATLIGAGVAAMTDQRVEEAGRLWHRAQALEPGKYTVILEPAA